MASSKNSNTEHNNNGPADTSKPSKKAANPRKENHLDDKKDNSNKKQRLYYYDSDVNKKEHKPIPLLSSSTDSDEACLEEERQEYKTEITNGPTSSTKPSNKYKVKRMKHDDEDEDEGKADSKNYVIPMNRVRTISMDQDVDLRVSQEAIFVISKATEMFLKQFTRDSHASCVGNRNKSLAYKHLSSVVSNHIRYEFLSDFVPKKIKAEIALKERNSDVNGG